MSDSFSSTNPSAWPGLQTIEDRESVLLAPYAIHSSQTQGRTHPETRQSYRGPFQRDRDRIIHTAAYRRLSHKTQVITGELGDYHRNRLTHTQEVASIARTIARALRLNEDLVEAMALLHDIGHPPFGHAGEDTLNECVARVGGFSHNRHALRIVEELENRYQGFSGLNLSYETLEGQRWRADKKSATKRPSLETQVVDAADSVAYDSHDADDALELGLLDIEQLLQVPFWRTAADRVSNRTADVDAPSLRRAVVHELIDWQVKDLLRVAADNLAETAPADPEAAREAPRTIMQSGELAEQKQQLESFLFDHVYRHEDVLKVRDRAQASLKEMFEFLVEHDDRLPDGFRARAPDVGIHRSVCDYLAGMTDRFASREHDRLCG